MKRRLLVLVLGVAFLVVVTALGTFITNFMPTMNTPQTQITRIGPYTVTFSVDPNPPTTSQPGTCSIQIQQGSQPVNGARVTLEGTQADMGLSTSVLEARAQDSGRYVARVSFSMSGSWQMQVTILFPGQSAMHAAFMVTAQ